MGPDQATSREAWQQTPLILLAGMGADERLFEPQRAAFGNLRVPKWIEPQERESLVSCGRRFAAAVDPGEPCFIGGASFGGFVALEMARYLQVRTCFLIGSVRSRLELPRRIRRLPVARIAAWIPWRQITRLVGFSVEHFGRLSTPEIRGTLRQLAEADVHFLRWASWAVATWQEPDSAWPAPICQIHGDRDRVLPACWTRPDRLIRGAGHLLSLTHAQEVNEFLRESMDRYVGKVTVAQHPAS